MKEEKKIKRLHELQECIADYAEGRDSRFLADDKLKVADLLLLLEREPLIQRLIASIAATPSHSAQAPAASNGIDDSASDDHSASDAARRKDKGKGKKAKAAAAETIAKTSAETRAAAEEDEEDDNAGFGSRPPARNEWHERREPSASLFGLWSTPASESAPVDPLRQQLAPELALLAQVQADAELATVLLGRPAQGNAAADEADAADAADAAEADTGETTEGRQLLRLIARAAQWDVVEKLWEALNKRCKQAQAPATTAELNALQMAVALHNLRWQDRQARLLPAEAGERYNFEAQQRGNKGSGGDTIRALWLPGLQSANGEQSRKALVEVA